MGQNWGKLYATTCHPMPFKVRSCLLLISLKPLRAGPFAHFSGLLPHNRGMLFLLRKILEGGRPVSAVESMVQYILRGMGVAHDEVDRIIAIDLSVRERD